MELISDGTEFEIKTIPGIMYETKKERGNSGEFLFTRTEEELY